MMGTASNPASSDGIEPTTRPRSRAPITAITLTVLLTVVLIGVLLYQAYTYPQPSRVLVVRGNAEWEGADLIVEGRSLAEPRVAQFQKLGNYVVPFYLWPGKYTLRVRSRGVEVFTKSFVDLFDTKTAEIDLILEGATTRPTTKPTTEPLGF
jgi:hypothetical protein